LYNHFPNSLAKKRSGWEFVPAELFGKNFQNNKEMGLKQKMFKAFGDENKKIDRERIS
jgi:hypothetical protein